MSPPLPSDPDTVRRYVDAWVADQVGHLDDGERAALEADYPHWRDQAARLIAEGLLAYVAIEMVAPDLSMATTWGDPHGEETDDATLAARLGAHLYDFVDYRAEFAELRERGQRAATPLDEPPDHEPPDDSGH